MNESSLASIDYAINPAVTENFIANELDKQQVLDYVMAVLPNDEETTIYFEDHPEILKFLTWWLDTTDEPIEAGKWFIDRDKLESDDTELRPYLGYIADKNDFNESKEAFKKLLNRSLDAYLQAFQASR